MKSLLTVLLASALSAQAPTSLSPTAFRDRLSAAIAAITKLAVIAVDDHTLRVKRKGEEDLTVYTDNAFAQYKADPSQVDAIILRYARVLMGTRPGDETVDQLVLVARPSDYVIRSVAEGASAKNFLPGRPVAGDLAYFLAVDSSETIRLAGPSDLDRWKLSEQAAWSKAIGNVKVRVGPMQMVRLGDEGGPSGLYADSGLAPSIIADPAPCGPTAPEGLDRQIVLVHSRDTLLFAIPSDTEQTRRFWATVKRDATAGQTLSSTPLTCRNGNWTVATAP